MNPDILVMDEPSSNLAPKSRRQLIELLKTFQHTKIIASHDIHLILELCRRTVILNQGQVVADGATLDIFNNQQLLEENNLEQPLSMQTLNIGRKHLSKVSGSGL